MFKDLFKLNKKRNFIEALGFFIVYFIFDMLICMAIGIITNIFWHTGVMEKNFAVNIAVSAGFIFSFIFCTAMAIAIITAKRQFKNIYAILSVIVTIIVTFCIFDMLGAFMFSLLTMFEDKSQIKEVEKQEEQTNE